MFYFFMTATAAAPSRSQLTFPTIIGGHITFCKRARGPESPISSEVSKLARSLLPPLAPTKETTDSIIVQYRVHHGSLEPHHAPSGTVDLV